MNLIKTSLLATIACVASEATSEQRNLRRRLQDVLVPFGANVRIGKGSSAANRVPTTSDNDGVATAVMNWFDAKSQAEFPSFLGAECSVDDTALITDDSDFQHEVSLICNAKFDDSTQDSIPTPLELMQAATGYNLLDFIIDFLNPSVPVNGAFQLPRRVSLGLVYISSGASSTGSNPSGSDPAGGATTPSPTPATQTAAPTPTAATSAAEPLVTEPIKLEWTIGAPSDPALLQVPTDAEWSQFVTDAHSFVEDVFDNTYNVVDLNDQLPEFVSLPHFTVLSQSYDSSANQPFKIILEATATFRVTQGTVAPPMWQWVLALRYHGLDSFRQDYLSHNTGIFQNPTSLQWAALED